MKRVVSAFLAFVFVFSCVAVSSAAAFTDSANHWANAAIEYMVGKSILNGYEDGSFRPDRTVTRAEFIKMLDETFGLTATTSINYTDVATSDWFYPYVAKAAAQGYLLNYGKSLNPSGALTRQEAAALLARYLELDPEKTVAPSTFPDYTSIKSAYRDYVLQAAAAGLFQGYAEDGTFRPDTPLTRAQALTILSRAAGSIYKSSTTGLDAGAVAGNAVITQSGITVSNANITGRLIITEGAANGTITLSGCTVNEMVVRGTANVILSDTEVKTMDVNSSTSGFTTEISLSNNSSIDTVELNTPADLSLASRTSITLLTVGKNAKRSGVTGSGTVKEANILSSGFSASKIPSVYDIATGISASFAGKTYTGNSSEVTNTGFSTKPTTYASSTTCYLTATAPVAGTVYYYYTTSNTLPTKTTFDSFYNSAVEKNSYTISANITRDVSIGNTSYVGTYPYIAVMFRDSSRNAYNPLLISNKASTGFVSAPAISTSNSTHRLTYSAVTDGVLYYYYTKNNSALTVSSFQTAYNAASSSYKGEMEVASSQSTTSALKSVSSVNGYGYVAILLEDVSGTQYQPFLVPTSSSYSLGSGGAENITCSVSADGTYLAYTPSSTGTLQYYFTTSSTVPTAAQFDTNYAAASTGLAGALTLTSGTRLYSRIADENTAYMYPYIVLRITSGTTVYTPAVLSATGLKVDISNSGFSEIPTVSITNGFYALTLKTSTPATVYYYLTDSTSIFNSSVFTTNYANATSAMLSTPNGGRLSTNGYSSSTLQTVLRSAANGGYRYMALMVSINNQNLKPIVVQLPAASTSVGSAADLFVTGPVYNIHNMLWHQIDFTPRISGRVLYYYTDDIENIDVDDVVARILFASDSSLTLSGYRTITANSMCQIPVDSSNFPAYAVLILMDNAGTVYEPVILTSDGSTSSSNTTTGFNGTPSVSMSSNTPSLSYNVSRNGTVHYYFTNTTYVPTDYTTFLNMFNATATYGVRGSVAVTPGPGTCALTTTSNVSGYAYVIAMYQMDTGSTGGYRKPIQLRINATSTGGSNAFSGEPYLNGAYLYFTPIMSGTLYYSFTDSNTVTSWMSPITALQQSITSGNNQWLAAALGTYTGISDYLKQVGQGGSTTVTVSGSVSQRSIMVNVNTSYQYMAVWMVSYDGSTMSQPSFISLSGYTYNPGSNPNPYPGTGSGGTSGVILPTTESGFVYDPVFASSTYDPTTQKQTGYISMMATKGGLVEYYYTNDTMSYLTSDQFSVNWQAAYSSNSNYAGVTYASAAATSTIKVEQPYSSYMGQNYGTYKYVWIRLTDTSTTPNTPCVPVRIQLY
ncbi:MAG: S-layer homology domain-containing protein [Clostridia bacterium]|nr:S-layer homology domain-containing protein [Clostridia bacterium]